MPLRNPASAQKGGLLVVGDSLNIAFTNQPAGMTSWPNLLTNSNRWELGANLAVPGQSLLRDVGTIYNIFVDALYNAYSRYSSGFHTNVICVWIGTNDLGNGETATNTYNKLVDLCQLLRLLGYRVLVGTILPRDPAGTSVTEAAFNTVRGTVNTNIRNNLSTFADGIIDGAADSRIGDNGDWSDTTYYFDGTHLKTAGSQIIADLVQVALGTIATGVPTNSIVDASLIAYWKLMEQSGTRNDSYTNLLNLTDNNTVGWALGPRGSTIGADFVSANSEDLSRVDSALIRGGDIDFTFSLSAKLDSKAATQYMMAKWGTGVQEYTLIYNTANDRFEWYVGNGTTGTVGLAVANALGSPVVGTWYHFILWHDASGNIAGIRINDTNENTVATSGPSGSNTAAFRLGGSDAAVLYMEGSIAECLYTKRLLTNAEKTYLNLVRTHSGITYPFTPVG